jgi:hypothetical protein
MVGAQGDIVARCCAWVSRQVPPYCGVLVLSPQIQALVNVHRPISMQCVNRQRASMDVSEQFGLLAEPVVRVIK